MKDDVCYALFVLAILIIGIYCILHLLIFTTGIPLDTSVETHKVTNIDINPDEYGYTLALESGEIVTSRILKYDCGCIYENGSYRLKLVNNLFWKYRVIDTVILD